MGREAFSFAFFSVLCPVRFPIPETIRNSPNSLYVQVSLRIEHHVRSLNVFTFTLTFIVWLNASIAIPLQLVTVPCIDNTMSELSVKDFLIA